MRTTAAKDMRPVTGGHDRSNDSLQRPRSQPPAGDSGDGTHPFPSHPCVIDTEAPMTPTPQLRTHGARRVLFLLLLLPYALWEGILIAYGER